MMIDRHFIGDVGLAVLLAFPTMALARPQPFQAHTGAAAPLLEKAAVADRTPVEQRYSLPN
jgi:hypothetical protein